MRIVIRKRKTEYLKMLPLEVANFSSVPRCEAFCLLLLSKDGLASPSSCKSFQTIKLQSAVESLCLVLSPRDWLACPSVDSH